MEHVNAIGDACPLPVVKTKNALSQMSSGVLEVLVDSETAVQNIHKFASSMGYGFASAKNGDHFRIEIEKSGEQPQAPVNPAAEGPTVVILSSDAMGSGDDALGRILMKGFVFALTQLDRLPDTVLLYNTGARLSVEGSASLADLISLEKAGTKVMTCGTCLNHFGIAEQLAVGEVTNMYSIVGKMRDAGRVLRP